MEKDVTLLTHSPALTCKGIAYVTLSEAVLSEVPIKNKAKQLTSLLEYKC